MKRWVHHLSIYSSYGTDKYQIKLSSGALKQVRHAYGFINRRPFVVLPGHHFIGLTGQIAEVSIAYRSHLLAGIDPLTFYRRMVKFVVLESYKVRNHTQLKRLCRHTQTPSKFYGITPG